MAITVENRTNLVGLVVGMFGAAPGASVLSDLVASFEAGATLKQIAANVANTTEFTSIFPTFLTNEEFATKVVNQLVGTEVVAAEKAAAVVTLTAMLNGGASRTDVFVDAIAALDAIPATNTAWASAAAAFDNKVAVAVYYSVDKQLSGSTLAELQEVIVNVDSTAATVATAKAKADNDQAAGSTFSFTTSVDTLTGGSGDDTFNATPGASNANTFTALDNIDGGSGTDTMNVSEIGAAAASPYTLNASATVKNIETLNYTVSSDNVGDTLTADVSGWTGLQTFNAVVAGTDAPVTITTKGNATSVMVDGSTTAGITDSATTDTLATATIANATGLATVTSSALTTLNLTTSTGGATVVAAAATRALELNLNGVTAGTVTDAEATSLTIKSATAKSSATTVTTAKAKTVTIDADESLSLTALNAAAATTLTVTGDSAVTLAGGTYTALTSIDSSAQTAGGIDTKAFALGTGVAFTGGAGADSIQIGATTKAITTGAGNDRVLLTAAVTTFGTGGSVDAGEGTADTIAFADGDDAGTVSAAATFESKISGFEVVELAGAAGAGVALNLANLDDIASVKLSADLAQALTVSNMASGGTLSATVTQSGATSVAVTNALTGTADVVNVSLAGAAGINSNTLTIADVETINYATDDTATTATGIAHTSNLAAAAVKTITVAGDAGLALTNTNTTVTSFDASGVTKGAVTWTTGALAAAADIKGGAGANTINFAAATKAVTYTGGAAVDTITANGKDNTINTAGGADVITLGAGANTVDAGDGADTITLGAGLNIVTGGAGTDSFSLNGIAVTNGNSYSTITDFSVGESITFTDAGNYAGSATLGAKVSLASTAAFADFLQAATAGTTAGEIKWFQYGGDTYVVNDASATASYVNGTDQIIKLTGALELASSTVTAAGVLTYVAA